MKETVFTFECRLLQCRSANPIERVKQKLLNVQGVEGVEEDTQSSSFVDLKVHVKFQDVQAAKDLHWKLTQLIDKADGIALIGVSSVLTDIFD